MKKRTWAAVLLGTFLLCIVAVAAAGYARGKLGLLWEIDHRS